jgi:tripartite-type tricarboxylate transporter receptor subunit TctC
MPLLILVPGPQAASIALPGAAALTDLIAGQVQMMIADTLSSIEHVRSGELRALAVTTPVRSPSLPELPTVGEFLPGFQAGNWFGVVAPRNTPPEIIDELSHEINIALAEPSIKGRLADVGATLLPGSPGDFGQFMAAEAARWSKVIRTAGIKID